MRRPLAILATLVALLVARPSTLLAHATLVRSTPPAGAHLDASPARVSLVFSEELEPALARLTLILADGTARPLEVRGDPRDVHALDASVGDALPPGLYRLQYRVVSADGHPVQGDVPFSVGLITSAMRAAAADTSGDVAAPGWGPTLGGAPVIVALLRGLAVAALMALAGLLACVVVDPAPGGEGRPQALRVARWLAAGAAVLAIAHLASWVVNVSADHRLTRDAIGFAVQGGPGRTELWRTGLAALSLWALVLARRPALALACATGALVASAMAGHAAVMHAPLAMPAKVLHLVAAALWLGGVLRLLLLLRAGPLDARPAHRVSNLALGAVLLVIVTGVAQALLFVASPSDLLHGAYGAILLAKVIGLLVLLGYGAQHRYRSLPRAITGDGDGEGAGFARSLRQEVALLLAVTLLGGLLACINPNVVAAPLTASHSSPAP